MGTPTTTGGSTCLKVVLQDHLAIDGTEDNGINTATCFYLVEWSGNATTSACRGATDGTNSVPLRGDSHPYIGTLAASRVEIRALENNCRNKFQARVEYTDDLQRVQNPLTIPPDIQWDIAEDGNQPYFIDNDPSGAKPTVNKAGERFAEFLQRYGGQVGATFTKNIPLTGSGSWNPVTAIQYCSPVPAINSDTFTFDGYTVPIYVARARGCSCGGQQIQNGVKYRVKKWSLAFKYNGWIDKEDNRGFNALYTMPDHTNKLLPIARGPVPFQCDTPWPLYPSGHAMPNITDIPTPQLTFYPYPQLAFGRLGFS